MELVGVILVPVAAMSRRRVFCKGPSSGNNVGGSDAAVEETQVAPWLTRLTRYHVLLI